MDRARFKAEFWFVVVVVVFKCFLIENFKYIQSRETSTVAPSPMSELQQLSIHTTESLNISIYL